MEIVLKILKLIGQFILRIIVSVVLSLRFLVHCLCKGPRKVASFQKKNQDNADAHEEAMQRQIKEALQTVADMRRQIQEKDDLIERKKTDLASMESAKKELARKCEGLLRERNRLLNDYDSLRGKLIQVASDEVANPFCSEYSSIKGVFIDVEQQMVSLLKAYGISNVSLVDFLSMQFQLKYEDVTSAYLTLNAAQSLVGTIGASVDSIIDHAKQLDYLRSWAFGWYYRPYSSSLLLLLEQMRWQCKIVESKNIIQELIGKLYEFGIQVDYIETGADYQEDRFLDFEVEGSSENEVRFKVLAVREYGVNHATLDVVKKKTKIVMNY